ncbi:MAG TPA: ABC transporter permease [Actinomycetota bacterium]|jgi:ABC-2 type transport system permease protein/oleandomycin transport system permease protein|nr:ABC transporter permease [Actinomycetota bacterium]
MSAVVVARPSFTTRALLSFFDSLIVARRNLMQIVRIPAVLVFELVQPVMFVLLFRYVFGEQFRSIPPEFGGYVSFLMPGIIVQNAIFGATTTAIGIAEDLKSGLVDRFRSLPMARSAMLAGRATSDLIKNFILLLVVVGIGYLVGFSFQNGFLNAIGMIVLVLAVSFAFSWVMAAIALAVKKLEAVQAAAFTGIFPLVFMSSALVPVVGMVDWLEPIARNNPISHWANLARYFAIGEYPQMGGSVEELIVLSVVWIVGILAVFMPLSIRLYSKLT